MILDISYTDDLTWPNPDAWSAFFEPIIQITLNSVPDSPRAWVSVLLTNDAYIHNLNKQYRGCDKPTNVLSFPMDDVTPDTLPCLGDVVLSFETITREAQEANITFEAHVAHMMVHGVLHLLGFEHEVDEEAEEMEALECCIMDQLGYANPYFDRVQ